jgi:hypothetical protein
VRHGLIPEDPIMINTKPTKLSRISSSAALLLLLTGASVPAFAGAGGDANLFYGDRGKAPPEYVHARKWASCARLYPTFNPRTGVFVGQDGLTHLCQ